MPGNKDSIDFSADGYKRLLDAIVAGGYHFSKFTKNAPCSGDFFLRHDIDKNVAYGLDMARIEKEYGIQAHYFFLLHSPLYSLLEPETYDMVAELSDCGHWIGLHCDERRFIATGSDFDDNVLKDLEILKHLIPWAENIVSFHNPSTVPVRREPKAEYVSTYAPVFFPPAIKYLSDSNSELMNIRHFYLVAKLDYRHLCGVLPCFIQSGPIGAVLNSMPFFGSSGGIVCPDKNPAVYQALFTAWRELAEREKCIAATIITSPFFDDQELYEKYCPHDLTDSRIGQITPLMAEGKTETMLFDSFTKNCRRDIRKAIKSGIRVEESYTTQAWAFLEQTHLLNMESIGGKPKPGLFFQLLKKHFEPESDYRLYLGLLDNRPVSALLLFYYNGIVEYFTPAVLPEYRTLQPQNLVIYTAMIEAGNKGYRYWNWGGTWKSQDGVYAFKSKWATHEKAYKYFIRLYDEEVYNISSAELVKSYPWFYVIPFNELQENKS